MFQQLRETGPGLLVPLAWLFVGAAHLGRVSLESVFIAHLVMATFITGFLLTGWKDMNAGALRGWRVIMIVGLGVTVLGIAGFFLPSVETVLWTTSLVGWMVLPTAGLAYTGAALPNATMLYLSYASGSALGTLVFLFSLVGGPPSLSLAGIALVGIGQTAGIVDAVVRF